MSARRSWLVSSLLLSCTLLGSCGSEGESSAREAGASESSPTSVRARASRARRSSTDAGPRYVGSWACSTCHAAQYEAWRASHHARAERALDPELDAAAFTDREAVRFGGVDSRPTRDGDDFVVHTEGPSGETEAFALRHVIGAEPLVQFTTEVEPGRLQVLAASYDPARDEWFDVFGDEGRRPGEWGHWTGRGMVWNSQCADCHNTDLVKGYDAETDRYETRFAERGVGCEACHGPGSAHVAQYMNGGATSGESKSASASTASAREKAETARESTASDATSADHASDASSIKPWTNGHELIDTCGACHSRRAELQEHYRPGDSLLTSFLPELPGHSTTWYVDGQVREEDYVWASFAMSRMYDRGVTCLDCHDPHGAGLRDEGNALCMRCHSMTQGEIAPIEPARHAHHDVDGPGGQCVDCHMPLTTYMQRDPRRDHGFTIPDPKLSIEHGVPNACNRCHDEQSARWAADQVEEWYGEDLRASAQRARLVARARAGDPAAAAGLLVGLQTEAHPTWRAIFAGLLEPWSALPEVASGLVQAGGDSAALVRAMAARALEHADPRVNAALAPLLKDPLRAVRVSAALAMRRQLDLGSPAGRELLEFFAQTADQPAGLAAQAAFWIDRGEVERALALLERAEEWDPHSAPLPRMRATVLDMLGRPIEAAAACERACELDPTDPEAWYALGLARGAAGETDRAAEAIERAVAIDSRFARGWYNLALLRNALTQFDAAIDSMRRAIELEPRNADFVYALATIERDAGRLEDALGSAWRVLELAPQHAGARSLAQQLEAGGVRR